MSETQIIHTISKRHHKLAIREFNPRHITLITPLRLHRLDVGECNGFNRLTQGHIGPDNCLTVRHIQGMGQQEVWIQLHIDAMLTGLNSVSFRGHLSSHILDH